MTINNHSTWREILLFSMAFLACIGSLVLLEQNTLLTLVGMAVITILFAIAWYRHIGLRAKSSIFSVQHLHDDLWFITSPKGVHKCTLDPKSTCTAAVIILLFRRPGKRCYRSLFLFRSALTGAQWSWLQMHLG
jgi:hypothetical protein